MIGRTGDGTGVLESKEKRSYTGRALGMCTLGTVFGTFGADALVVIVLGWTGFDTGVEEYFQAFFACETGVFGACETVVCAVETVPFVLVLCGSAVFDAVSPEKMHFLLALVTFCLVTGETAFLALHTVFVLREEPFLAQVHTFAFIQIEVGCTGETLFVITGLTGFVTRHTLVTF